MTFTIRSLFVWVLGLGMATAMYAQSPSFKRADYLFENEAFPAAAKLYAAGLAKGYDQRATERLAKCYQNIGQVEAAAQYYGKAIEKTTSAQVVWDYAQVLKSLGSYENAAKMFDKYGEMSQRYEEARVQAVACEQAAILAGDGKGWKVDRTNLNSAASDFGPWITDRQLIFASARNRGFFTRVLNLRNANLFYDLYAADIQGPVNFGKAKLLRGSLKTRYHDGPVAFTRDMTMAYITRSNLKGGKLKRDQQDRAHLQIYSAQLIGRKYKHATLMPFNGDGYSTGHPALAADGKTMVFASDKPGGKGGSDLYITHLEGNKWSEPINLGPEVNTIGDELFPNISSTGMLTFASDGHPGLGGLDIFLGSPLPDGKWGSIQNAGAPVNSPRDDFGMVWDNRGQGYFCTSRLGSLQDDIYHFTRIVPLELMVTASNDGAPVDGAKVKMLSSSGAETNLSTDARGKASSILDWSKSYKFLVSRDGYRDAEVTLPWDAAAGAGGRKMEVQLYKYPVATVAGTVIDAQNEVPLSGAEAQVVGMLGRKRVFSSDGYGNFGGQVDTASIHTAIVKKPGYLPAISDFSTMGMTKDLNVPVRAVLKRGTYVLAEGMVVDKSTGLPLGGANLRAVTGNDSLLGGPIQSRKDGMYWIVIDRHFNSDLLASRDGYFTSRISLGEVSRLQQDSTVTVRVELVPAKVNELVKVIYYDYRESFLTRKAKNELDEIVYFLLDNPSAVVELSSHTDARGSDTFNQTLSQARAKAAVDYVVSQGVKADRIQAKGYGESQLTNDCGEGKECSEEMHGMNRRTEVRVVRIEN